MELPTEIDRPLVERMDNRLARELQLICIAKARAAHPPAGLLRFQRIETLVNTPDRPIGLTTERTIDDVVGVLGILKSGAPYLPIAPFHPAARVAQMLDDAGVRLVVSHARALPRFAEQIRAEAIIVDSPGTELDTQPRCNLKTAVTPQNLAYVLYTSGSTGVPKGVLVEHRSVMGMLRFFGPELELSAQDTFSLFCSLSFVDDKSRREKPVEAQEQVGPLTRVVRGSDEMRSKRTVARGGRGQRCCKPLVIRLGIASKSPNSGARFGRNDNVIAA